MMSRSGSNSNTANFSVTTNNMRLLAPDEPRGTFCGACDRRISDGDTCDRPYDACPIRAGDGPPYLAGHWLGPAIEYRSKSV
jgi:hypothetical protein